MVPVGEDHTKTHTDIRSPGRREDIYFIIIANIALMSQFKLVYVEMKTCLAAPEILEV